MTRWRASTSSSRKRRSSSLRCINSQRHRSGGAFCILRGARSACGADRGAVPAAPLEFRPVQMEKPGWYSFQDKIYQPLAWKARINQRLKAILRGYGKFLVDAQVDGGSSAVCSGRCISNGSSVSVPSSGSSSAVSSSAPRGMGMSNPGGRLASRSPAPLSS